MRIFTYEAQNQQGHTISGSLQAETEEAAVAQLRAHGYWVTRLSAAAGPAAAPIRPSLWPTLFPAVKKGDLVLAFRQLATMVGAGMSLFQSLGELERNTSNPHLRQVLRDVLGQVQTGGRLSDALAKYPAVFSDLVVGIVAAAENSGKLDTMLKTLAQYLEDERQLDQLIRRETLYPKILLGALLVIPVIAALVIGGLHLATMGNFALAVSLVAMCGLGAVGVTVAGVLLARVYRQSKAGNRALDALKLRLPLIGKVAHRFAVARLSRALAAMYQSGLPLPQSLLLAGRASGNTVIADAMARLSADLRDGRVTKVSEGFAASGLFPSMVVQMVSTGEQTGNFDTMLDKVAEYYEDEAQTTSKQLAYTAVPIAVLIFGAVVLLLAVTFYSGLIGAAGL